MTEHTERKAAKEQRAHQIVKFTDNTCERCVVAEQSDEAQTVERRYAR